ncbi:MAG: phosphoglucosamine mutase [Coriobacteriia bacterium]|nr:phosphoglucosamine mutase [Coriobacteriia bacterium]MCL2536847.1 phosphoglucosamine mutase [Coriobacteriia bacterium]
MSKKLFGTDGIRGVANTELTPELAFKLGRAVVATLPEEAFALRSSSGSDEESTALRRPRILIGRDTRRSGNMLEGALSAGITSAGADAVSAGIVPTPAVALLIKDELFDAGIVISASHNPPEYNGLKVFLGGGKKLSDEQEAQIEELLHTEDVPLPLLCDVNETLPCRASRPLGTALGRSETLPSAINDYVKKLVEIFPINALSGMKVAIDCGHGASSLSTPAAFKALGAEVTVLNDDFNGDDINVNCGSTNLGIIAECVQSGSFDLGIAHDGDADRMLAVDEHGNEVDGDHIIAICAKYLKETGQMGDVPVVGTIMANLGFNKALESMGIPVELTAVGDRYVLERMYETNAVLGGEQSGHLIFLQHNSTGDGLLSALMLSTIVAKSGQSLSELAKVMTSYPQELINIPVASKDIEGCEPLQKAMHAAEEQLGDSGRILVRASGTEKKIRVMVEAQDATQAVTIAEALATIVREQLG